MNSNPSQFRFRRTFLRPARAAIIFLAGAALQASAAPSVSVDKNTYSPNETITVTFSGGPGNARDWVGIYPASEIPDGDPVSLKWAYTHGTQTVVASNALTSGTLTFPASLADGQYRAWFLSNDGYTSLAEPALFTVASSDPASWLVERVRTVHGVAGTAYSAKVGGYASPGASRMFVKVSGPEWLTVAVDGSLSGTPSASDTGLQEFTVRVSRSSPASSADVPLAIEVFPAGQEHVGRLSVMTYNLWHEWTQVNSGYQKGLKSIILSGADIVGLQESSTANAQQIASDLGWFRATTATGSTQIVSRYPIMETYTAGITVGARIRVTASPARDVILYNCHTDYRYYGPYAAQWAGATEASVLQEENRSSRASQIAAVMQGMREALSRADSVPVFLTGDFNAPSHLDWTTATAASHGGVASVAWPTSVAVLGAGMIDSFRSSHPDPAAAPANSWSTIHKGSEAQDRIDFIYHKGASLHLLRSTMFSTAIETTIGPWNSSDIAPIKNNTWPSDHYSFVSTYALEPVDADGNGLSDAWEQRWFESLGNAPDEDANSDGTTNRASMLFNLAPIGPSGRPLSIEEHESGRAVVLSLSDYALSNGVSVSKSEDLATWKTLWSFDEDPWFEDPSIIACDALPGAGWRVRFGAPDGAEKAFYRIHYAE